MQNFKFKLKHLFFWETNNLNIIINICLDIQSAKINSASFEGNTTKMTEQYEKMYDQYIICKPLKLTNYN